MMAAVLVKSLNHCGFTLSVRSEKLRKKAALQGNRHSMRAIIGAELRKNVLHVRLHGGFGQVELIGNDLVGGACRDTAKYLGMAAANLVVLADPEMLVLGGIMASAADLLLDPMRVEITRRLPRPMMDALAIATASLGVDAAAIGAARLAGAAPQ